MKQLEILERQGGMRWRPEQHAWNADPAQVMEALGRDGFQEFRREVARGRHGHVSSGGMWQGLDPQTGAVATVIWAAHESPPDVCLFLEVEGERVEGPSMTTTDGDPLVG